MINYHTGAPSDSIDCLRFPPVGPYSLYVAAVLVNTSSNNSGKLASEYGIITAPYGALYGVRRYGCVAIGRPRKPHLYYAQNSGTGSAQRNLYRA